MRPPLANVDVTDEVREIQRRGQPEYRIWYLYPFAWTVSTAKTGSKTFQFEVRFIRKFSIAMTLFWKARGEE